MIIFKHNKRLVFYKHLASPDPSMCGAHAPLGLTTIKRTLMSNIITFFAPYKGNFKGGGGAELILGNVTTSDSSYFGRSRERSGGSVASETSVVFQTAGAQLRDGIGCL